MATVYVYKSGDGYRVYPGVVVLRGGQNLEVVNATGVELKVSLPEGARAASEPANKPVSSTKRVKIKTKDQGDDKTRAYEYTVATSRGVEARGNSDPVLIIEN